MLLTAPASQATRPAGEARPGYAALRRSELLLILAFWTLIALLTIANALLDPRGRGLQPVPFTTSITLALFESYLWAAITPFVFILSNRVSGERANWISSVVLLFVVGVFVSIFVDLVTDFLRFKMYLSRMAIDAPAAFRVRHFWFMNEFIVYTAVVAGGFARVYFLRYQGRREETMRLQAQAAQLQAQLADARLAALRTQLNPHFLFNTLHAVSALVERDPRGVRRMIARLSELLRTTLEGVNEQEVTLGQELQFIERYVDIMRIRFQGRLEVETSIAPDVLDALVPNLILQPLVENALEHGVGKIDGVGRVRISACRDGDRTVLTVRDNGPVYTPGSATVEGVGLRNTRERLAQLYGSAQGLLLKAVDGGGLLAEVVLPFHTKSDLLTAGIAGAE